MPQQPGTPRNPVKEVRQALGLNQAQMGAKLGCSSSPISHWEKTGTLPSKPAILDEFRKLAKQAGIEIKPRMRDKSGNKTSEECQHEDVLVDYLQPLGCATGLRVAALRTSELLEAHPTLELIKLRCAKCRIKLSYDQIKDRISKGGDLYHPRFIWCEDGHTRYGIHGIEIV